LFQDISGKIMAENISDVIDFVNHLQVLQDESEGKKE